MLQSSMVKQAPKWNTFGTTNKSKYGVRKIEAISSSNIIPVYCIDKMQKKRQEKEIKSHEIQNIKPHYNRNSNAKLASET